MDHLKKIKDQLSPKQANQILLNMIRIRTLEQTCAQQYSAGHIRGFLHLYVGEEAIAASIIPLLKEHDQFFGTYREHAHALMKGVSAKSIMAEMFGKAEGCSKGRGGSMHLFDLTKSFYGGNAIVSGHLPLAVGMALSNKIQKKKEISVCFFGEGAIAEGEFHESFNIAQLWKLPVLFVCENNYYAMGTSLERSESEINLVKKAQSYQVQAKKVNGMSIPHLLDEAKLALNYVRNEKKPFFLECDTYRFSAHSMFDSQNYRSKDEVEKWKKLFDPITIYTHQLKQLQWINDEQIVQMTKLSHAEMDDAVEYAREGHVEDFKSCLQDVMIEVQIGR